MKTVVKSNTCLVRNPQSFWLRIHIPRDLLKALGKKALRYSLNTGGLGLAKIKARYIAGWVQLLFMFLREGGLTLNELTDDQVKNLVEKYIKASVKEIENWFYQEWDENYRTFDSPQDLDYYRMEFEAGLEYLIVDLTETSAWSKQK